MKYHKNGSLPPRTSDVFVFGSNLGGIHGAGAALIAYKVFGYPYGKATGLHTNSNLQEAYGIPTKDAVFNVLSVDQIKVYIEDFKKVVEANPGKEFFITKVGCGLAGYSDKDIAPMFKGFPDNCSFALEWKEYIDQIEMDL